MTDDFTSDDYSELLSAYLDDELGPADRARVEQRLTESAEFRQLRDELQAVRTSLQRLPSHRLNRDLASSVLKHVQSMAEIPTEPQVVLAEPTPGKSPLTSRLYGLKWSILAVAVALLIMVFGREKEAHRDIALRNEQPARDPVAVMSAPTTDSVSSKAEADYRSSDSDTAGRILKESERGGDYAQSAPKLAESSAESTPLAGKGGAASKKSSSQSANTPTLAAQKSAAAGRSSKAANQAPSQESDDELLVVHFDITASAARSQAFEKLLLQNAISLDTPEEPSASTDAVAEESQKKDRSEAKSARGSSKAKELAKDQPAAAARPAEAARERETARDDSADKPTAAVITDAETSSDAYFVEASPEQISATIAGLETEQNSYRSVQVEAEPTSAASQGETLPQSGEVRSELYEQLNRRGQVYENRARAARVRNTFDSSQQQQAFGDVDLKSANESGTLTNGTAAFTKRNAPSTVARSTQNYRAQQQPGNRAESQQRALFLPRVIPDTDLAPAPAVNSKAKSSP